MNAFVYYGLNLDTANLHGDPYLNFALGAVIEIPSLLVSVGIIDRVGRKPVMLVNMMVAGLCLIANAFIPQSRYFQSLLTI